ncbi:hypothetical protein JT358_03195 [Micrococcales bacterium 31B]|nr:hypothetical protein [Micrococcales bacterium 31B]
MFTTSFTTRRTLGAALAALAVAATLGATAAQPAAAEPSHANGGTEASALNTYKLPFSERLYGVTPNAAGPNSRWLTWDEWAGWGYPQPTVTTHIPYTEVIKNADSDELFFATADGKNPLKINEDQWRTLGYPLPRNTGYGFYKAANGNTVLTVQAGKTSPVYVNSYADWVGKGYPTPVITDMGTYVYREPGTPDLYLNRITNGDCGSAYKLTYDEWLHLGAPQPKNTVKPPTSCTP